MSAKDELARYPSTYEIQEALEMSRRGFMDNFAQARGVFIFRATKTDLGRHLTSLYYQDSDLEEIRDHAYRVHSKQSLTGFIVASNEEGFNPVDVLDSMRSQLEPTKGITLSSITEVKVDEKTTHVGEMEYSVNKPARIGFLQHEPRKVKYTITPLENNSYQVYVQTDSSGDAQKFATFFKSAMEKEVRLETIAFDLLDPTQTISFFDDLSTAGMGDEWRLSQVNRLIFRRGKLSSDSGEDDETTTEAKAEVLSGISRAILDGKNLRDNPFVKQAETDGYRFSAMNIEFENIEHAFVIEIRVEFKLRPEIFEIEIESYKKRVADSEGNETLQDEELSLLERVRIQSDIWKRSKAIYDNLVTAVPNTESAEA